jgi:YggT family protein
MLNQIGTLLVKSLVGLIVYLALARFLMQTFRLPFRNPIGQFVLAFTDWGVKPLRRFIPGWRGYDLSSLVFAFICQLVLTFALYVLLSPLAVIDGPGIVECVIISILELVRACLYLAIFVVFVDVILSWVNPQSPFAPFLRAVTQPMYGWFRRFIPPIGGFDLSPLFVLLLIQVLLIMLNSVQGTIHHRIL